MVMACFNDDESKYTECLKMRLQEKVHGLKTGPLCLCSVLR